MSTQTVTFNAKLGTVGTEQLFTLEPNCAFLCQNRSNKTIYFIDGVTQATVLTYSFLIPPYSQGAFPMSSRVLGWIVDPSGVDSPSPTKEIVTVTVTSSPVGNFGVTPLLPGVLPVVSSSTIFFVATDGTSAQVVASTTAALPAGSYDLVHVEVTGVAFASALDIAYQWYMDFNGGTPFLGGAGEYKNDPFHTIDLSTAPQRIVADGVGKLRVTFFSQTAALNAGEYLWIARLKQVVY